MRFTGKLHQVFSVALVPGTPSDSLLEAGQAPAVAALRIQGPSCDAPEETAVLTASGRHLLPTPDRVRFWNRYALQVLRDGTVQLVVNERLYWQSPTPLSRHDLGRARVVLGSQSLDTEIAHGPLRVYRGAKYRLPVLEPAPAPR
jgi:hypothetical protein